MKVLTKTQATQNLLEVLPSDIKTLSKLFTEDGVDLFLVGGCVRDAFLGKTPKDFDVATNAMPERVMNILRKAHITCQLQGEAFGVVVARMSEDIEIATFRVDLNNTDDRNTDVKLGVTIEEDVQRRDLTINALFMNLDTNEIIDLVGGIDDLNNGIIRTVGTPSMRFSEDNLRKLRAMRFATRLGFVIEDETFQAIKDDPSLNVSEERIVNELQNAFETSCNIERLICDLFASGLIFTIFQKVWVKPLEKVDVKKISSFTTFIAELIDEDNKCRADLQFCDVLDEMHALKFPSKLISGVETLLTFTDIHTLCPITFTSKLKSTDLTEVEVRKFHRHALFGFAFNFKHPEGLSKELMDKGFKGKELGDELKRLARKKLDDQIMFFTGL